MVFAVNNNSCKVVGVGTIKIKMIDAVVSTLLDVRHLRFEKESYISRCYRIGAMESKRYINLTRYKILSVWKASVRRSNEGRTGLDGARTFCLWGVKGRSKTEIVTRIKMTRITFDLKLRLSKKFGIIKVLFGQPFAAEIIKGLRMPQTF